MLSQSGWMKLGLFPCPSVVDMHFDGALTFVLLFGGKNDVVVSYEIAQAALNSLRTK